MCDLTLYFFPLAAVSQCEKQAISTEGQVPAIAESSIAGWRVYRNIQDLITIGRRLMLLFPGDAWVPHMRTTTEYPSDANAIEEPASEDEKILARDYICRRNLKLDGVDFVEAEIYDAVAFHDRDKSGTIFFSSDLAYALERIQDDNEAEAAAGILIGHEHGHDAWYENRGQQTEISPDSFKGVTSKTSEVVRLHILKAFLHSAETPWRGNSRRER